ncbi:MAG: NAD(P)-dependent oxidoreductase [Thermoplasmata archaeon]
MILVVGGSGFVGSNTTEALVDMGRDCVLTRHTTTEVPRFLQRHVGGKILLEPADATSIPDLLKIGERHQIDGIFCSGRPFISGSKSPLPTLRAYFDMLTAIFRAAEEWNVDRVVMTSSSGVYLGLGPGPMKEDQLLPIQSFGSAGYQKLVELASAEFSRGSGISSVCVRLAAMFGPGMNPDAPDLTARLPHAAVRGTPPSLKGVLLGTAADDAVDRCYIKDVGRALALVQTSQRLPNSIYNVGSGRSISNRELVNALQDAVPGFTFDLPPGRNSPLQMPSVDTARLRMHTGFSPKFDTRSAIADYVGWLQAGNAV